jgi:L-cysteine/cystine lyase
VRERAEAGFAGIRHRADLLMDLLSEEARVAILSPRPAQSGLVSFEIEGVSPKSAVERLLEQKFVVRFIPQPNHYVRVSTHLFNTERELQQLARAVGNL